MNDLVTIISSLGFPIVACIGCGYFIKYQMDVFLKQIQSIREEHKNEVKEMTKAINNNTSVIQALVEKLDKEG